jgi:hypothetical protein
VSFLAVEDAWLRSDQPPSEISRKVGDQLFFGVFILAAGYLFAPIAALMFMAWLLGVGGFANPLSGTSGACLWIVCATLPGVGLYFWFEKRLPKERRAAIITSTAQDRW